MNNSQDVKERNTTYNRSLHSWGFSIVHPDISCHPYIFGLTRLTAELTGDPAMGNWVQFLLP